MLTKPISIRINNQDQPLRLTLGALAEIEDGLGGDIESLKSRLARPRVGDILVILCALLRGGGGAFTLETLKAADVNLSAAADAIARAFSELEAPEKSLSAGE